MVRPLEESKRYLDVVVTIQRKAVIHSCRQNNHAPLLHCYTDPLFIFIPHIKVTLATKEKQIGKAGPKNATTIISGNKTQYSSPVFAKKESINKAHTTALKTIAYLFISM
jgi:hypothetical protein